METQSKARHRYETTGRGGKALEAYAELTIGWDPTQWTRRGLTTDEGRWSRSNRVRIFWSEEYAGDLTQEDIVGEQPDITIRGEDPESDKAWDAYNRWEKKVAKEALVGVLSKAVGRKVLPNEVKYSRKAGCSCPCSPGFVTAPELGRELVRATDGASWVGRCDLSITWYAV